MGKPTSVGLEEQTATLASRFVLCLCLGVYAFAFCPQTFRRTAVGPGDRANRLLVYLSQPRQQSALSRGAPSSWPSRSVPHAAHGLSLCAVRVPDARTLSECVPHGLLGGSETL